MWSWGLPTFYHLLTALPLQRGRDPKEEVINQVRAERRGREGGRGRGETGNEGDREERRQDTHSWFLVVPNALRPKKVSRYMPSAVPLGPCAGLCLTGWALLLSMGGHKCWHMHEQMYMN